MYFSSCIVDLDTLPCHCPSPSHWIISSSSWISPPSEYDSMRRAAFHCVAYTLLSHSVHVEISVQSGSDEDSFLQRGDWITSLSQLSVMARAPSAMLTPAAIATTPWRRCYIRHSIVLSFLLLVLCICFLWVCFYSGSWHQLLLIWACYTVSLCGGSTLLLGVGGVTKILCESF